VAIDGIVPAPESTCTFPSRDREGAVFRILLLVLFGLVTGCRGPNLTGLTEEEPPQPSTEVQVADPLTSSQLLSGWYKVEGNAWRWTAGKFAVILRPPIGSAVKGATLTLNFAVPAVVISRLHSVTLWASIQGTKLAPETYEKGGRAVYTRDVPASLLSSSTVRIDFELNRVMLPGNGDHRELGVIADRVGLEAK
jgi:hypothetical protein